MIRGLQGAKIVATARGNCLHTCFGGTAVQHVFARLQYVYLCLWYDNCVVKDSFVVHLACQQYCSIQRIQIASVSGLTYNLPSDTIPTLHVTGSVYVP